MIHITYTNQMPHAVKFRASANFMQVVSSLKTAIPEQFRAYEPERKQWLIFDTWWLNHWFAALRLEMSPLVVTIEQAGAQSAAPVKAQAAHAVLYVTPDAPPEVVRAAYLALAKLHHPDTGGDTARMQAINAAYESLT